MGSRLLPDLTDCRALTLWRWWAVAFTALDKRVENRPWPAPESTDVVLLHAGTPRDRAAERRDLDAIADLTGRDPAALKAIRDATPIATSAIVAVARLGHVCDAGMRGVPCGCGRWAMPGQYHWRFADDLLVLPEPVPARGYQRLWRPSPVVVEQIRSRALAVATSA